MENINQIHADEIREIAFQKSKPYCYQCSIVVKTKYCPSCNTDDLMRLVEGVGNEYGIEWVVEHLINNNLKPVDLDAEFHELLEELYPDSPTLCGAWVGQSQADILKDYDPIQYREMLLNEIDGREKDGVIFTIDNGDKYFLTTDLIAFIDENLEVIK
jgi:hypothetical protein